VRAWTARAENAELRARLEEDDAIRRLLARVERWRRKARAAVQPPRRGETSALTSGFHQSSKFANMANLFVVEQLHSTCRRAG
jgi:hypothetical protein